MQPQPPPCDSPKVVTRNICPYEEPAAITLSETAVVNERVSERMSDWVTGLRGYWANERDKRGARVGEQA